MAMDREQWLPWQTREETVPRRSYGRKEGLRFRSSIFKARRRARQFDSSGRGFATDFSNLCVRSTGADATRKTPLKAERSCSPARHFPAPQSPGRSLRQSQAEKLGS